MELYCIYFFLWLWRLFWTFAQGSSRRCVVQLLMKRISYHKTSSCRCFMTSLQDEDNYVWALAIYPQGIHFIFTIYFKNLRLSSFPDKWNLKSWGRWSLTGKADSPQFVYIYFTAMTNRMSWYILSKLWNSYLQKYYKWN